MLADNPSQIKVVVGAEAVHAPPPEDAPPLQRRKDIVSI